MTKTQDAKKLLDEAEMRMGLLEFLHSFKRKRQEREGITPEPFVAFMYMDDEEVKRELKNIILGK